LIDMNETNPYATSREQSETHEPRHQSMTIARAFAINLGSGVGLAAGGAGIGDWLGCAAPAYYWAMFSDGERPGFDPVQVGFGLGLTQGLASGIFVGGADRRRFDPGRLRGTSAAFAVADS
jgi:hypothetical protein